MAELWHFNISWCVGLSGGWIICPQRVLLLSFKGEGGFVTFQRQLHHRAEQISSKCGAPLQRGTLLKPEQRNNYFSRPPIFIRRSCSPSGRWTLSAHSRHSLCRKQGSCRQDRRSFRFQQRGRPVPCHVKLFFLFHSVTADLQLGNLPRQRGRPTTSWTVPCVLWFFHR